MDAASDAISQTLGDYFTSERLQAACVSLAETRPSSKAAVQRYGFGALVLRVGVPP